MRVSKPEEKQKIGDQSKVPAGRRSSFMICVGDGRPNAKRKVTRNYNKKKQINSHGQCTAKVK